ncbi:hypothetical protein [Bifidobacterium platyrrhinorum]|uniref:hypothetical protein n=1 Tax=Bifidobacterium platyrrhinorum TaxID=2661628 RepID=UPI0013D6F471|nr:hypothetical protein [Bifidobacterium platyrrhinorum]
MPLPLDATGIIAASAMGAHGLLGDLSGQAEQWTPSEEERAEADSQLSGLFDR